MTESWDWCYAESGNEVCFPSLDGAFGGVASMGVWWDQLKVDVVVVHEFLSNPGASLLRRCSFGLRPPSDSLLLILVYARSRSSSVRDLRGSAMMLLEL